MYCWIVEKKGVVRKPKSQKCLSTKGIDTYQNQRCSSPRWKSLRRGQSIYHGLNDPHTRMISA